MSIVDAAVRVVAEFAPPIFAIISLIAGLISARRASKGYQEAKQENERLQLILAELNARRSSMNVDEAEKIGELINLFVLPKSGDYLRQETEGGQQNETAPKFLETFTEYLANSIDVKVKGVR